MSRIALVAPPLLRIPPRRYAGTERVIAALGAGLHERGHAVTLFAAGDSEVPYELIPTVPRSLWDDGYDVHVEAAFRETVALVTRLRDRFDVIHSHLEWELLPLANTPGTPVVTTFHGRLDLPDAAAAIPRAPNAPLVSISESQRRWYPEARWVATIPHGLAFPPYRPGRPGPGLAVVGRASHEKGIAEAIEVARRSGRPLAIAAKALAPDEQAFVAEVIEPAVAAGVADYLGEIDADRRDVLLAASTATLMLGRWPEPFGLVAIESMAQGTPVIGRRAGALPELIEHGVDGFIVDDVRETMTALSRIDDLDRDEIARRARERFAVGRMVDRYEGVYARLQQASARPGRAVVAVRVGGRGRVQGARPTS